MNKDNEHIEDTMRNAVMAPLQNMQIIDMLTRKLHSKLGRIDLKFREGTYVKYEANQGYSLHGDAAGMSNGRDWTLLVALEAAIDGGETYFPHLKACFKLRPGDALVWPNYKNGMENLEMDHEALVVNDGNKIVINAWFDEDS